VAARIERTLHQEKQSMAQPKVWFVTGASRGFGRIWTEAALKRGDRVAATARDLKASTISSALMATPSLPCRST
jgi:NAD(P)-dependent dehydrogenase (short-subunit alcohol dehydrogenase family)